MPVVSDFNDVILGYKCSRCKEKGCREISLWLNRKCKTCGREGVYNSYSFRISHLDYSIYCEDCKRESAYMEKYDNELNRTLFEGEYGDITGLPGFGEHGDPMFVLTSLDDRSVIKTIEHPANLKNSPDPEYSKGVPCPYEESEKNEEPADGSCCQKMPGSWKRKDGRPEQSRLVRRAGGGDHRTVRVGTLQTGDGVVITRYVCLDHKERMMNVINNLASDPEANPSSVARGNESLDSVYIGDKRYRINDRDARLHRNRLEATRIISDIPLSISNTPGIADTDDGLLESMRYSRAIGEPDTPVYEISGKAKPPDGMKSAIFRDDNKLGIDPRNFFSFDVKEPAEPEPEIPCEEICRDWERLELIRATMPFERHRKRYRLAITRKRIRQWQISHGPSKFVPTLSMPFIPTVTPRERVKIETGLEKEMTESGLVAVHIDMSGSMGRNAWYLGCPYILTREECIGCNKSGSGYEWLGDRCAKAMDRLEIAKRMLIAIIADAKERGDRLMVYGFSDDYVLLNPPEYIVKKRETPVDNYDTLLNFYLNKNLETLGGTDPDTSLIKMVKDLKDAKIGKMTTILLTDGEFTIRSDAWAKILTDYGPIFVYQIGESSIDRLRMSIQANITSYGWNKDAGYPFSVTKVGVSDGGISLIRDATSNINKSQR
jgi:hypothetical protein